MIAGLDLGTSNCGIARWDAAQGRAELIELPSICRKPGSDDPLEAPRLVPAATHAHAPTGMWARWRKRDAWIGRQAQERNEAGFDRAYAPTFKMQLMQEPERPLVRLKGRSLPAREVAQRFMRELLRQASGAVSTRIRDLTIATPVDAYERYRSDLVTIAKNAGVKRVRFVDEPVAAAMGYGLALDQETRVLVVDIGGGTMHAAMVALTPKGAAGGACRVLSKTGLALGGDVVDRWLLSSFCERLGFELSPFSDEWDRVLWHRFMLDESRRVKESLFFREGEAFVLTPPEDFRRIEARLRGPAHPLHVFRQDVVEILKQEGFYTALDRCLDDVCESAPDEVLVTGGSTLLPGVHAQLEARFGRAKLRAWSPFEAVAHGACVYAVGAYAHFDYVLHDYAIVTHDPKTRQQQHTIVVPRGTRFPSQGPVWQRELVPTCALGEPETSFKLVVCEVGRSDAGRMKLHFDEGGRLRKLAEGDAVIVPLNEHQPTLGVLDPPHAPNDQRARLRLSLSLDAERWLCATVVDLKSGKSLLENAPVVRLV
jgi:molecular chaperone DnaK (HSP70)